MGRRKKSTTWVRMGGGGQLYWLDPGEGWVGRRKKSTTWVRMGGGGVTCIG